MECAALRHNVRSIAREASAAPAAKFKSPYRTSSPFGPIHMYGYGVDQDFAFCACRIED